MFLNEVLAAVRSAAPALFLRLWIPTGDAAEDVLRSGAADLVAVGRALHADPGWTATVLRGAEPRPCIGCNQGCIDELHTQRPIWCVVNPSTGHEWQPPVPPSGGSAGSWLSVPGRPVSRRRAERPPRAIG